jgi:hypothetical protein
MNDSASLINEFANSTNDLVRELNHSGNLMDYSASLFISLSKSSCNEARSGWASKIHLAEIYRSKSISQGTGGTTAKNRAREKNPGKSVKAKAYVRWGECIYACTQGFTYAY